ncbi:MAG: hypothetical protein CSA83_00400 [Actinomycetales bacterium]|nr:MAG: hypothetical protein CSA83_00400 [Actinomycetales bacterium]
MAKRNKDKKERLSVQTATRAVTQWPLLVVLLIVAIGSLFAVNQHWRLAALVIGSGVGLAAVLRLLLPDKTAGLLVVRARWFDVLLTGAFGAAIIIVAMLIPDYRS